MQKLTIITYHYVRPIKNSNFPRIKGLEFESFKKQINYLQKNYKIIEMESLIEFAKTPSKDNGALLYNNKPSFS